MNRAASKVLIGIMWLAMPLVALSYWQAWDRLPALLATHFDAAGRANGWMPAERSLIFGMAVTGVMLVIFTIVLTQIRKGKSFFWAMLVFSYVLVGIMVYAQESILSYNLHGDPVHPWPILVLVGIACAALVGSILGNDRGKDLLSGTVLAEEVHSSPTWGLVLGVPAAVELVVTFVSHNAGLKFGMGMGAVILSLAAVLAWRGFHYIFNNAGVEIRTFGFRLQSIPVNQIRGYAADRWNVWGGYGIRGMGDCRAYVWGNNGVRIKTATGQVFLGHRDPQRLIRDLDAIKQIAH